MIYDTLEHAGQYRKLSGNLAKALDYLTGTELETVEAGRALVLRIGKPNDPITSS